LFSLLHVTVDILETLRSREVQIVWSVSNNISILLVEFL
jgi:hypothetical protein